MLRKIAYAFLSSLLLLGCVSAPRPQDQIVPDALILGATEALPAGPLWGQDTLAVAQHNFNVGDLAAANPRAAIFTTLDTTFGASTAPVVQLLAATHPAYFEVKIINGSCHSNHNCGPYEYAAGSNMAALCAAAGSHDPKLKVFYQGRVGLYKGIAAQAASTIFIVSPINEHACTKQQYQVLADWTLEKWPGVQLANSPLGNNPVEAYRGAWIEKHGTHNVGDAQIVSLDGFDATQINFAAFKAGVSRVKLVEIWQGAYNCRIKTWVDPRARVACPTQKLFETLAHIADPVPPLAAHPPFAGKQCKRTLAIDGHDIWKPASEYAGADKRTFLPVLITSKFRSGAQVQILASNGAVVGRLGYFGSYQGGGWRWYSGGYGSGLSGWDLQSAAQRATGSPFVWLNQGNTCVGPFVPGQRQGKYD